MKFKVLSEIIRLHKFFEDWYAGTIPNTVASFNTFEKAISPSFHMISPSGNKLHSISVVNAVREEYNSRANDASFKISIENVTLYKVEGDMVLASYEEHQIIEGKKTARISSVILKTNDVDEYPLLWFHLQETWITDEFAIKFNMPYE